VISETLKVTSFDHTGTTKVAVLGNYRQMGGKSSVQAAFFFGRHIFCFFFPCLRRIDSSPYRSVHPHQDSLLKEGAGLGLREDAGHGQGNLELSPAEKSLHQGAFFAEYQVEWGTSSAIGASERRHTRD
jgi:hypothetical protein